MTEPFAGSALLWLLLSFKRLKGFQKYVYYLEISALGHNSLGWINVPKLNVVIYILIMQVSLGKNVSSVFPKRSQRDGHIEHSGF